MIMKSVLSLVSSTTEYEICSRIVGEVLLTFLPGIPSTPLDLYADDTTVSADGFILAIVNSRSWRKILLQVRAIVSGK